MEPQPDGARSGGGGGGSKPPVVACAFFGDDGEKPRKNARVRREKEKPPDGGGVAVKSRPEPSVSWSRRQIKQVRGVVAEGQRVVWPSGSHTVAAMIASLTFAAVVAGLVAVVGGWL